MSALLLFLKAEPSEISITTVIRILRLPAHPTARYPFAWGNGAGGFSGTTEVSVGTAPVSLAVGDFNNDGKQDFAAANQSAATVSIRLGDGAGNFSGTTDVGVGTNPSGVAVGDFNNDGNQDFAATSSGTATVSIRIGDGLGGFSGTTNVSVLTSPVSVAIGDFNNDGTQDFAATIASGLGYAAWYAVLPTLPVWRAATTQLAIKCRYCGSVLPLPAAADPTWRSVAQPPGDVLTRDCVGGL